MVNEIGLPPTSQPEEGFIETANQKDPSIQKAVKSPDLERISAPDKERSWGIQMGWTPKTCPPLLLVNSLIINIV